MNYGALGSLTNTHLMLPSSVLRPICTGDRGRLTVMLYPPPLFDADYTQSYQIATSSRAEESSEDFILSSIPSRLWRCAMRLEILLNQRSQSLIPIAQALSELGISIITTECTRTAYRYATWNLTAYSEKLANPAETLNFDVSQGANREVVAVCRDIEQALLDKFKGAGLFVDPLNANQRPVLCRPLGALAYFDAYLSKLKEGHKLSDIYHLRPIELQHDGSRLGDDGSWRDILKHLEKEGDVPLPTFVVANLNYQQMIVRVAVMRRERQRRFLEATVDYHRYRGATSTRGLLASLLKQLPPDYNMWKLAAHSERHTVGGERGTLYFLVEDEDHGDLDQEGIARRARTEFESLRDLEFPGAELGTIVVQPLRPETIHERIVCEEPAALPKIDVVLSYGPGSHDIVRRIERALQTAKLTSLLREGHPPLDGGGSATVPHAMSDCRELCLVLGRQDLNSAWVRFEVGAAWALGLQTVVFLNGITPAELPQELRSLQCATGFELGEYVEAILQRQQVSERIRQFER